MLPRVLEPEVMETLQEAVDYDRMDHSQVNAAFVDDLLAAARQVESWTPDEPRKILDVGTGTARIPILLCQQQPDWRVVAIDLAASMLQIAQRNVIQAQLQQSIRLEDVDAKGLPFSDGEFDAVMSNTIVHHIPEPGPAIAEMVRVLRPGGLLFLRDLFRPGSEAEVEALVELHTVGSNAHQKQLFRQSLQAALTVDEVGELLEKLSLPRSWVRPTSDRHWTISGCKPVESST